jgi:DNA-binding NtrC family response regulator
MDKSSLIFIIDDDFIYGKLVQASLDDAKFTNIESFTDESECLEQMSKKPKVLIANYQLTTTTGLQLIEKAKELNPTLLAILISAEFHYDIHKVQDERFIRYVDKYIIKGMDDTDEIIETLTQSCETTALKNVSSYH